MIHGFEDIHPKQGTLDFSVPPGFNKHDDGKVMMSLVEPAFIEGMAKILTIGGKNYGIENWKTIPKAEKRRYKDALLRHINEYMKGNILDYDTHENHLLHAACNLMFLHYFDSTKG